MTTIDILIPTYRRPSALALTLSCLAGQTFRDFRVVVSDQTEDHNVFDSGEVQAAMRLLRHHGHGVESHKHLPRRGMAEHRQFLLDQVTAPYALFLDDDLLLEAWTLALMVETLQREKCGFVGSAPIGLSFVNDIRAAEQEIEFWEGSVAPECIGPDDPVWERHRLHNAANVLHVQERLGVSPREPLYYKVAWVGGCVLYRTEALRGSGGYQFWSDLPHEHCGEDVQAQQQVMRR
jgi:hypothetical protein